MSDASAARATAAGAAGAAGRRGGERARAERLAAELREREIDVLLVASPVNVRYLTGFTGSNGLALLSAREIDAEQRGRFFTDFRYRTQSSDQVDESFAREIVVGSLIDAATRTLDGSSGKLGFDQANVTVAEYDRLRDALARGWELVPCAGVVERLRAVKDEGELMRIGAAAQLADEALRGVLEDGVVGRSERDVAIDLELRMRRLGAEAVSFPSIVAAGAHGALPHAQPRAEPIPRDVLLTIDWGALLDGYCSDCTRTYATGERVAGLAREIYELVLSAQEAGVAAIKAGPTGREVDAVARELIERGGQGEHFGHGLGHGVGMEVHEAPRLSRTEGEQPLLAGNVVTVEPGVYLPDEMGVRIEDLVVVRDDAQEVLTGLDKALTVVS
jgi:Xaa-Pro aminopeptidase